jgi:hypothetical protein
MLIDSTMPDVGLTMHTLEKRLSGAYAYHLERARGAGLPKCAVCLPFVRSMSVMAFITSRYRQHGDRRHNDR